MLHRLPRPDIVFDPDVATFLASRSTSQLTVLSGPNNSGKSYLLKSLCNAAPVTSHFFGCNRFFSVSQLLTTLPRPDYINELSHNFKHTFFHPNVSNQADNTEGNLHDLEQVLRGLNNEQRQLLFKLFEELIGHRISMKHTTPDNDMTPLYVDVEGESLQYGSTGTRLLLTLLGTCFDTRFTHLFLDEPELGLSPKIQTIIARFFTNPADRRKYFEHLKGIYIATHSHHFLDRIHLSNNFIVAKTGKVISTSRVESISQFHELQFTLLGNDLEALFMPSGIVIVEGKTDQMFLRAILNSRFPERKITVVLANGDGEMGNKLHTLREAFGDLERGPYRSRLFILLDSVNSAKPRRLAAFGINEENVNTWSKNGIEHYYPRRIMKEVFSCGDDDLDNMVCGSDGVSINGLRKSKADLGQIVCSKLNPDDVLDEELLSVLKKIDVGTA